MGANETIVQEPCQPAWEMCLVCKKNSDSACLSGLLVGGGSDIMDYEHPSQSTAWRLPFQLRPFHLWGHAAS